jgi:hypothetical protein
MAIWRAPIEVSELLSDIKRTHHSPRLDACCFAVCFDDSKPFVKNKINLGKLSKFSNLARLYQREIYDLCLTIPCDVWSEVIKTEEQRRAFLDLHLTRCDMEYVPEVVEENNKKTKVVDEFGRVKYTNEPKYDSEGNVKWVIQPLDLMVFAENVRRHGLWQDELVIFEQVILSLPEQK